MANEIKVIKVELDMADAMRAAEELNKKLNDIQQRKTRGGGKNQEAQDAKETATAYDVLNQKYKEAIKNAREMAAAHGVNSKQAKESAAAAKNLGIQLKSINGSLETGRSGIMGFAAAGTVLPGILGRISFGLLRVGQGMLTLLVNPIFQAIAAISALTISIFNLVKGSMEFALEMSTVKAITNSTNEEFVSLKENAKELGATTLKTAVEVAKLQVALGRLGFTVKEIIDMTPAVINISIATRESLEQTAEVIGGVLRAYNLTSEETTRVADVMAKSFMTSALTLDRFRLAMTYIGPIARQTGVSIEETTAMLSVLSNNAVLASKSGTAVRRIMTELSLVSGTLTEKIRKLADAGITVADASDEVGKHAMTALLALAANVDQLDSYRESFLSAAGASEEMARIIADNLTGDVTLFKSVWKGLLLSIEDGDGLFTKFARWIVSEFTGILQGLTWIVHNTNKAFTGLNETLQVTWDIVFAGKGSKNLGDGLLRMFNPKVWKAQRETIREQRLFNAELRESVKLLDSPEYIQKMNDMENARRKFVMTEADILKDKYNSDLKELEDALSLQYVTQEQADKARIRLRNKYLDDLKKLNKDNQSMVLSNFDYESRIMEARAKSLEEGRQREIELVEAEYTKKLNMSETHIKRLMEQERKKVRGATAALREAQRNHAEYEIALAEEKGKKLFDIEIKYSNLRISYTLQRLSNSAAMIEALGARSAEERLSKTLEYLEVEESLRTLAIKNELISEEEKALKLQLLGEQFESKRRITYEQYRKDDLKEFEDQLQNEAIALQGRYDSEIAMLDELAAKKKKILEVQMQEELLQAGNNAALKASIEMKYQSFVQEIDRETALRKIENMEMWAQRGMNLLRELNSFSTAIGERELNNYAKTIEGKANYDELYAQKKLDLEIQAAKREKALGVFGATIDTAAAIMRIWADKIPTASKLPLTILAGLTGAAQIGTIMATPLPTAQLSKGSKISASGSKGTTSEKFHTGTYRPASSSEEREITRTLLTTERVLSPSQTSIFDSIIGRMQSLGGASAITENVGVSQMLEERMIERAMTRALQAQKAPVMSWTEFENQSMRQKRLKNNAIIR